MHPLLKSKRFRLWTLLAVMLVGSLLLLLNARAKRAPQLAPETVTFRILDPQGRPVRDAEVLVRRAKGESAPAGSYWDGTAGVLRLPKMPADATLLIAARGYRIMNANRLDKPRDLVLHPGIPIRLRMKGDAPALEPPLVGILRVRPTAETMAFKETGSEALHLDLSELMVVMHESRPEALELPREKWGFAASEEDAAMGLRVPFPGTYIVRWGILDERPGTWFAPEDGPEIVITVADQATPQVFDVEVPRTLWNRTLVGLREWIAQVKREKAEAGKTPLGTAPPEEGDE
jgi:hypothetical protein